MLLQGNTSNIEARQHIKEPFQECSSFLITPSLQHTTVGDISVFKDMPIKKLDLRGCARLTGEWLMGQVARISGVASGQHLTKVMPGGTLIHTSFTPQGISKR